MFGLLIAGCNHVSTTAEREQSFRPYDALKIDGEPSRDFLGARYGALIGGVSHMEISRDSAGRATSINFDYSKSDGLGFGSAAAIDRRGYFLTAAHCVPKGSVYVAYGRDKTRPRIAKARVVWSGRAMQMGEDLAVLKVPYRLDAALEWSDDVRPEEAILTAGLNYPPHQLDFDFGFAAGKISKVVPHAASTPTSKIVYHSSPTHGGDSGGPAIDAHGRLIGIVTQGGMLKFGPFSAALSIAERPDPAWLRALVDDDFAHHSEDRTDSR